MVVIDTPSSKGSLAENIKFRAHRVSFLKTAEISLPTFGSDFPAHVRSTVVCIGNVTWYDIKLLLHSNV